MESEKSNNPKEETLSSAEPKQLNYLLEKVNTEIELFTKKTNKQFKLVRIFKLSNVILSATITIILGINLGWLGDANSHPLITNYPAIAKDIALVLGAILTLLTTLSIFWSLESYWLQNKVTKQQLKLLRNEIKYLKNREEKVTQGELDDLFNKFQNILRQFHLYWEGVLQDINRKDKDEAKTSGNKN